MAELVKLDLHPDPVSLQKLRKTNNDNYQKINENFDLMNGIFINDDRKNLLLSESIIGTKQIVEYANNNVSKVTHKRLADNVDIRTDTFIWSTTSVKETRTLNTGETLTLTTNLNTLETVVEYS